MHEHRLRHAEGRPPAGGSQDGSDLAPRDQILGAAAALFAEHGYTGTTTRAIAERVGIGRRRCTTTSRKDEILLELLEISVRPSLAFVSPLLAEPDRPAALYALALIDVETLLATPHNVGVLYLSHEVQQPRFDTFRAHRARSPLRHTSGWWTVSWMTPSSSGRAACSWWRW